MKILVFSRTFPPYKGGISHYIYSLLSNLGKEFDIVLLTISPYSQKNEYDYSNFCKIYRTVNIKNNTIQKIYYYFLCLFVSIKYIKQTQIIFASNIIPQGLFLIILKKLFPSKKYFLFTYGSEIIRTDRKHIILLRKFILKNIDMIITISNFTKNKIKKIVPWKDPIIIYPGYEGEFFIRKNVEEKFILLTVAALEKRKGHLYVLKALNELKKEIDFEYWIIGNGRYKNIIKNKIEAYSLSDRVKILNNIDNNQLKELYKQSSVFIMPTIQLKNDIEGFGKVYVEAGAFSLPVIATSVGGVKDIVKDNYNGIIVREKNIKDIKNAIKILYNNKDMALKLGKNGLENAKKFSYEKSANKLAKFLLND